MPALAPAAIAAAGIVTNYNSTGVAILGKVQAVGGFEGFIGSLAGNYFLLLAGNSFAALRSSTGWDIESTGENDILLRSGSSGNIIMNDNSPGNVGIGTNAPAAKLHVNGSIICSTQYLYFASATNCAGVWMDADKQYVFKIKMGVYSAITNAIP
jgi:hypothetical protein